MRNRLLPRSSEAEPQKREEYYVDERKGAFSGRGDELFDGQKKEYREW